MRLIQVSGKWLAFHPWLRQPTLSEICSLCSKWKSLEVKAASYQLIRCSDIVALSRQFTFMGSSKLLDGVIFTPHLRSLCISPRVPQKIFNSVVCEIWLKNSRFWGGKCEGNIGDGPSHLTPRLRPPRGLDSWLSVLRFGRVDGAREESAWLLQCEIPRRGWETSAIGNCHRQRGCDPLPTNQFPSPDALSARRGTVTPLSSFPSANVLIINK